jgi:cutinase
MENLAARHLLRAICAAVALAGLLPVASTESPRANAAACPDIEVVFARGTTEPPGVGGIGQVFVDALRSKVGGRAVGVYAVNYPASNDFVRSTPAGADDASAHLRSMAANCPNTRMVLGGYSQGAAVIDLATTATPEAADHVAAAALFGAPSSSFSDTLSPGPLPTIGAPYAGKTINLCVPNDPICFEGGRDIRAHGAYAQTGMVAQAAAFAADRL